MMDREQEDLILAQAERIKARRLQEAKLESFEKQTEGMIRWDNRGSKLESYVVAEAYHEPLARAQLPVAHNNGART